MIIQMMNKKGGKMDESSYRLKVLLEFKGAILKTLSIYGLSEETQRELKRIQKKIEKEIDRILDETKGILV